ncbi:toxin TcdB middle/N-terminal domain-containing protein [Chromatiaceae bacterium AAb-1]|nr:toxin TcdB middle/N-terminal domain-containing protein [Chromatiaceae bacterium AAb-1]
MKLWPALRLFVLLFILSLTPFTASASSHGYTYYTDTGGNIYLQAPRKFILIHGEVSVPLSLLSPNAYLKLHKTQSGWQVSVLTEAQWKALQLLSADSIVNRLDVGDINGDGQNELQLFLNDPREPVLTLSNLSATVNLSASGGNAGFDDPAKVLVPVPPVSPTIAGLTAGEFRVDESGAATYSMPLSLPEGIAGVKPQLAFSYNSSGGDGYMGAGWSFAGASAITRCPKNFAVDNAQGNVSFTASDRLCIDGQRLIRHGVEHDRNSTDTTYWGSSQYHTELDGMSIIRRHGNGAQGPLAFSVETKSGEIHYYGDISAVSGNDTMGRSLALTVKRYGGATESGSDAFFETANGSNKARMWALKAIRDVKGNYIAFRYYKDSDAGEHYLTEVHYTGRASGAAPFARVILNYENNTKMASGFQAGSKLLLSKILTSVTAYQDAAVYRHYQLNYFNSNVLEEKNYLLSIQECTNTARTSCLPATTFDWQRPPAVTTSYERRCESEPGMTHFCWDEPVTTNFAPFNGTGIIRGSSVERHYQHIIDINGDGYADMVYPGALRWYVRLGSSSGLYNTEQALTTIGVGKKEYVQSIDYNGDGQRDLLIADSSDSNWHIISYEAAGEPIKSCDGGGFIGDLCKGLGLTSSYKAFDTGRKAYGFAGQAFVADIDGDGLEDIVYMRGGRFKWYRNLGKIVNGSPFSEELEGGLIANGNGSIDLRLTQHTADMKSAALLDINGDGKTDLLVRVTEAIWLDDPSPGCQQNELRVPEPDMSVQAARCGYWRYDESVKLFVSTGTALVEQQSLGGIQDIRAVDLNGDGYTDIMYRSGTTWHYRLSDGTKFLPARSTGLSTPNNRVNLVYFLDLNGDGRTDILLPAADNQWSVYLSRPSRNSEQILFERRGSRAFDKGAAIQFADVNGDGKLDLLTATNNNGWKVFTSQRPNIKEHVINKITSGFGSVTTIDYKNITDKTVYFRDASSNAVDSDYFSPRAGMYVVSRVSSEVDTNQYVSVNYQYGGLLLHKKGRGLLGFEVLRTIDNQSGVLTETVYHQHWPYTGTPKSTVQYKDDTLLSYAENTVARRSTAYGGVLPYISKSTEVSYQLGNNGQQYALAETTSSFVYDAYGNLTSSTVTQSDAGNAAKKLTTATTNTFNQSAIYQRYGRLTASTVTKTLDGNSTTAISRRSSFTYNSDLMLATEVISPEDIKTRVTTSYGYDAAGNITARQVTAASAADGTAIKTRASHSTYDSRFRYLASQTDEAGLSTTYSYNGTAAGTVTGLISYVDVRDSNHQQARQYIDAIGRNYRSYIKGAASSDAAVNRYTYWEFCSKVTCTPAIAGAYMQVRTVADGQPQRKQFIDKYGREVGSSAPLLDGSQSVSRIVYDNQGRPSQSYEPGVNAPSGHFSAVIYDALGRVVSTQLASGGTSSVEYKGLTTVTTDPMGKKTTTTNNYLGQTAQVMDALNNTLNYDYDAYGNLKRVTAVNAQGLSSVRTVNLYDTYGRKAAMQDQDKGNWSYNYNAFGELLSQTDAKNQLTDFTYDHAGRMLRRYDVSGTTCWEYGSAAASYNSGKLIRVSSYSGSTDCATSATPLYRERYSYNSRGGVSNKLVQTPQGSFSTSSTYDSYGRPDLLTYPSWSLDPTQDDIVIKHVYQNGMLKQLKDNKTNRVYQDITAVNARGQVTGITYANGVTERRDFIPASGWLDTISVKKGSGTLHNLGYEYDLTGNVTNRAQSFGLGSHAGFNEVFGYDDLHRVKNRTISNLSGSSGYSSLPAALRMNEAYGYDHWGNLTAKTHIGYYQYDNSKTNRLTGVWQNSNFSGTKHYSMSYDANGNVTHDGKRSFGYTGFDKPSRVTQGNHYTDFEYGPDRQLYRRTDVRDNNTTDTLYIDGLYEQVRLPEGTIEHKFYVGNAVITKRSNNAHDELYLHKDAQGSTLSITNASGNVLQQFIYDPWGKQYSVSSNSLFTTYSNPGTSKGYTGHNMVNDVEVIHMGGRTYNPVLGRFMQADPFIQAPDNLQNYNRYSYVLNNPMSYTDPSGYNFLKKSYKRTMMIDGRYTAHKISGRNPWIHQAGMTALNFIPIFGQAAVAHASFDHTLVNTGSLRAAATSAAMSYAASYVGGIDVGSAAGNLFVSSVAGGIFSSLQGGKFGHGFVSAGLGTAFSGLSGRVSNPYGRVLVSAAIGGTVSKVTGGKFVNGAGSAAFVSAIRADWGDDVSTVGDTLDTEAKENKEALQREINKLEQDGILSRTHRFDTPDEAAKEVLNVMAPLSREYGLEVGGNIYKHNGKYQYTMPHIGDSVSVNVSHDWIGYHTHPSGVVFFSNSFATAGGGNDALWVKQSGKPLYMGVQLHSGAVSISVCEPGRCPNIGQFGTKGRVIQ